MKNIHNDLGIWIRFSKMVANAGAVLILLLLVSGCSQSATDGNNGPWLGDWVQVNFLSTDDNGTWDSDIVSGIGFVASISETEWTDTDDDGDGCALTMSYSVDSSNRFSREAVSAGSNCPTLPLNLLKDSGRLEFSNGDTVMIQWFDLQTGDDISAFKWVRR